MNEIKKKILVVNPNSSEQMTEDIKHTVQELLGTYAVFETDVVRMPGSPIVLESFCDYMTAGSEVCKYIREHDISSRYSAVVLACFGDPQLQAVKEICPVPVIGIAEAAMSIANLQGYRFSILAASSKAKPMMEFLVKSYGLESRCASVETFDLGIEEMMGNHERMLSLVLEKAGAAVGKGAETVILGCAGMTSVAREAGEQLGIPILDPNVAGICEAAAMAIGGFGISKVGLYQQMG